MSFHPVIQEPQDMASFEEVRGYGLLNENSAIAFQGDTFIYLFNRCTMQSLFKVGCNQRVQTCSLISLCLQRNMAFSRSKVLLLEKEVADHMKMKNGPNKPSQADMFKCVRLRVTFLTFYFHHEYHSFTRLDIELSPRVHCLGRPSRYGIYEIKMLNGRLWLQIPLVYPLPARTQLYFLCFFPC